MRIVLRGLRAAVVGMLVAISLGALAVWIWGDPLGRFHALARFDVKPSSVESTGVIVWRGDGRLGLGQWQDRYDEGWLVTGRRHAAAHGAGWRLEGDKGRAEWLGRDWEYPPGLVRAQFRGWTRPGITANRRMMSAPCWLLAVAAGAWPMVSLALGVRRHVRRWRRSRVGLCRGCGYDLRASPVPDGTLLPRCPECGRETPAPTG